LELFAAGALPMIYPSFRQPQKLRKEATGYRLAIIHGGATRNASGSLLYTVKYADLGAAGVCSISLSGPIFASTCDASCSAATASKAARRNS
jgi:hypothetical protein